MVLVLLRVDLLSQKLKIGHKGRPFSKEKNVYSIHYVYVLDSQTIDEVNDCMTIYMIENDSPIIL